MKITTEPCLTPHDDVEFNEHDHYGDAVDDLQSAVWTRTRNHREQADAWGERLRVFREDLCHDDKCEALRAFWDDGLEAFADAVDEMEVSGE